MAIGQTKLISGNLSIGGVYFDAACVSGFVVECQANDLLRARLKLYNGLTISGPITREEVLTLALSINCWEIEMTEVDR